MLDRAALEELFDYTDFTWSAYERVFAKLPPDSLSTPVAGSGWPALCDALFHIAGAWDGWLAARLNLDEPLAEAGSLQSWDELNAYRSKTRGWLRRIFDETPDDALFERDTPLRRPSSDAVEGGTLVASAAEVIAHLLLHERGHHGDISTLLYQLGGGDPLRIDYLSYVVVKRRRAGELR